MANLVKVARYRNSPLAAAFGVPVPLDRAANQIHRRYGVAVSHALTVATMVNAGIVASEGPAMSAPNLFDVAVQCASSRSRP